MLSISLLRFYGRPKFAMKLKFLDIHVFLLRNAPHLGAGAIRATPIEDTGTMGVLVWNQPSGVESIAQK